MHEAGATADSEDDDRALTDVDMSDKRKHEFLSQRSLRSLSTATGPDRRRSHAKLFSRERMSSLAALPSPKSQAHVGLSRSGKAQAQDYRKRSAFAGAGASESGRLIEGKLLGYWRPAREATAPSRSIQISMTFAF